MNNMFACTEISEGLFTQLLAVFTLFHMEEHMTASNSRPPSVLRGLDRR